MTKVTAIELMYRTMFMSELHEHDRGIHGPNKKLLRKEASERHIREREELLKKCGWSQDELTIELVKETTDKWNDEEYQIIRLKWLEEERIAEGRF